MKTRIISALIALPCVIIPLYLGGYLLYAVVLLSLFIGLKEFNRAFKIEHTFIFVMQLVSAVLLLLVLILEQEAYYYGSSVLLLMLLFIFYVIMYPRVDIKEIFHGLIGFYYIVMMIFHILLVRQIETYGGMMVWMIFIIAFGSDSCAYFTGVLIGKHPLAKVLSPKKTIEGAIGGVIGSAVLSILYAVFVARTFNEFTTLHYIGFGLMGAVGSVFSQFGDMAASAMKRAVNIKDFGHFMPGHGGIIDRMDSIIFVAPVVYYALLLIL